ncbi:hypothetical protein BDN72DRAFT_883751, partial [Pluteus cervinus]
MAITRTPTIDDDSDSDGYWGDCKNDWEAIPDSPPTSATVDSEQDSDKQEDSSRNRERTAARVNDNRAAAASHHVVNKKATPFPETRAPSSTTPTGGRTPSGYIRDALRIHRAKSSSHSKDTVVVSDGDDDDTDNE